MNLYITFDGGDIMSLVILERNSFPIIICIPSSGSVPESNELSYTICIAMTWNDANIYVYSTSFNWCVCRWITEFRIATAHCCLYIQYKFFFAEYVTRKNAYAAENIVNIFSNDSFHTCQDINRSRKLAVNFQNTKLNECENIKP